MKNQFRYLLLLIFFFCINEVYAGEKDLLTQLVGSKSDRKTINIIYFHPEPEWEDIIFKEIINLKDILRDHGYELEFRNGNLISDSFQVLRSSVIEPDVEKLKELAASFKNIKDCEVFVLFSHGDYTGGIPSRQGPAIAYWKPTKNIIDDPRVEILNILKRDKLGKYLYPADLESDSATPQNEYKGALILDSSIFDGPDNYKLSDDFLNNGIAFLMTCNSNYYWNVFEKKGAKVIFYVEGDKKTEHLSESFIRIITAMLGEGSIPTKSGSANIIPYYIDTHEAFNETGVIGVLSIHPEKYDYNSSRVLLRSPHIEELIVYNSENSEDIYYHYKYGGSRKYNPEESYPGDSILKIKGNNSTDSILNTGICRKGIPKNSRARIEILFSKPHSNTIDRPSAIDVKLKYFVWSEEGYKPSFIDLKKTDKDKNIKLVVTGSDHWTGVFDLTEKQHQDILSKIKLGLIPVNILVSYKDPQKKDKDWFLDSTGDGKWMKETKVDGERIGNNFYDNNHWFMVGSEPVMTVSSMEIDKLYLPFQQAPPDGQVNMQPVMLEGDIV